MIKIKKIPSIKKDLKMFLMSEEGKDRWKKTPIKMGIALIAVAGVFGRHHEAARC